MSEIHNLESIEFTIIRSMLFETIKESDITLSTDLAIEKCIKINDKDYSPEWWFCS